eukprot:5686907-Karenia_brevis.AAC.1
MDVEEIDKLEKEAGKSGENALKIMLTQIYHQMWKGPKEATIQAMMAQAKQLFYSLRHRCRNWPPSRNGQQNRHLQLWD